MELRTTCKRSPRSVYRPTAGARRMADRPRVRAYTDNGSRVPEKMVARYSKSPNSKTREFHVDKKWER